MIMEMLPKFQTYQLTVQCNLGVLCLVPEFICSHLQIFKYKCRDPAMGTRSLLASRFSLLTSRFSETNCWMTARRIIIITHITFVLIKVLYRILPL